MIKNKTTIKAAIWSAIAVAFAYGLRVFPYGQNQILLIATAMMAR